MKFSDTWHRFVLLGLLLLPTIVCGQPAPVTAPPSAAAVATAAPSASPVRSAPGPVSSSLLVTSDEGCGPEACCPPSMAQKLFIGVGGLALVLIFFFLFIRVMSSQAIKQGTSVLQARHRGIALALFLSTAGLAGLFFFVTGCWGPQATICVAFMGAVWLLHTIYALAVLRGK